MIDVRAAAQGPDPGGGLLAAVPGPDRGDRTRHRMEGRRRVADLVGTTVLLVVLVVEAIVASWGIVFLSLAFASCSVPGNSCNVALGGAVVHLGPVVVGLVFVVTLVVAVSRIVRRRLAWPIPVVGVTAVVVVFFACRLLADAAVTLGV